jgi:competence protein ComEA
MSVEWYRPEDERPPDAGGGRGASRGRPGRLRRLLTWGLVGSAMAGGVGLFAWYAQRPPPPPVVVFQPPPRVTPSPPPMTQIVVHVSGAVAQPGIYRLPVGSRIDDAIKQAGGAQPEADLHRLNLAARVADGQQVVVPRRATAASPGPSPEAARPGSPAAAGGSVNLNTASVAELDGLPGVGPVTAQRIVAYREQHGPFTRVDQLREANLVNKAMFERIKDRVVAE